MKKYKTKEIEESHYLKTELKNENLKRCDDCLAYVDNTDYHEEFNICDDCLGNFLTGKENQIYDIEFFEDIFEDEEEY